MNHPVTKYVEQLVAPFLRGGEMVSVREHAGETTLLVEVVVDGDRAKGVVIGAKGETITAIRHLAARLGKVSDHRVRTMVEVIEVGEVAGRGRRAEDSTS